MIHYAAVESVYDTYFGSGHQCHRKPGYGPDGLYCKQHDPAEIARRDKARQDLWDRKAKTKRPMWYAIEMLDLLRESKAWHVTPTEWRRKRDALLKKIDAD